MLDTDIELPGDIASLLDEGAQKFALLRRAGAGVVMDDADTVGGVLGGHEDALVDGTVDGGEVNVFGQQAVEHRGKGGGVNARKGGGEFVGQTGGATVVRGGQRRGARTCG